MKIYVVFPAQIHETLNCPSQEEVNGMMQFYARLDIGDGTLNETAFPAMPIFEEILPDFSKFLPAKGWIPFFILVHHRIRIMQILFEP